MNSIIKNQRIFYILTASFICSILFCVKNQSHEVLNKHYFYLNTDAIIDSGKIDFNNIKHLINSAKYNALVTPESLKKLQWFRLENNNFKINCDNKNILLITLDPFCNYVKSILLNTIDGSKPAIKQLDTTDIQKLFWNYVLIERAMLYVNYVKSLELKQLIRMDGSKDTIKPLATTDIQKLFWQYTQNNNDKIYTENKIYISFSTKSNLAGFKSYATGSRYREFDFFINVYDGDISKFSLENYCKYIGFFEDLYVSDESKINLPKKVIPEIIESISDISGYSKRMHGDCELNLIKPPDLNKNVDNSDIVDVIVFSYSQLGGVVKKFVFVYSNNRLQSIKENTIAEGVGDDRYRM